MYIPDNLHYDPETGIFTRDGKLAGTTHHTGYRDIKIRGKKIRAHRVAWFIVHGWLPQYIDHINRVKDDNRIANLRPVTKSQNAQNMKSWNKHGVKGVRLTSNGRWQSRIRHNYKLICLGTYDTKEEAHQAYRDKALELFGDYAHLE